MMKLYHITHEKNLPGIKWKGLLGFRDNKSPLYLTDSKNLQKWLWSMQGNFFSTGRGGILRIIEVKVPSSSVIRQESDVGVEFEYKDITIPRDNIKILKKRIPIKEASSYTWNKSKKKIKWRSRKRKSFGVA